MDTQKLSVEENIKQTIRQIENMTREILRLEGTLRVFQQLKDAGVDEIDVNAEKLKEIQEKVKAENNM